MLFDIINRLHH